MKAVEYVIGNRGLLDPDMQLITFEVSRDKPCGMDLFEVRSRILSFPYYVNKTLINELLPTDSDPRVDSFKLCSLADKKQIVFILNKLHGANWGNHSYVPGPEYQRFEAKELTQDIYPLDPKCPEWEYKHSSEIKGCLINPEKLLPALQMVLYSLNKTATSPSPAIELS